jgi:gluconolactonase
MERIASGLAYPEGPVTGPDGELYVVELGGGTVRRIDSGQDRIVAELGGAPNGAALDRAGRLVVCNNGGKHPPAPSTGDLPGADTGTPALQRVVPATGQQEVVLDAIDGVALHAPNDICPDRGGGFWFTDPSWVFLDDGMAGPGSVCHVGADGHATRAHTGLRFPNGLALDETGSTLYVTESSTGGVWAFGVDGPGALADPRPFASCGAGALPDGLALDGAGRLLVAGHGSGLVHVFGPDGSALEPIAMGAELGLSNLCFGGVDFDTIFVTAAATGEVYALAWTTSGLPLTA